MYKILRRKQLNDTVVRLDVEAPFIAKKAKAGQFIILRIDERGERMPLTIADTNAEEGSVSIIFQIVGQTTMLLSQMNEGDCLLDFVGPLGAATEFGHIKKACVIGGGVGNAIAYPSAKALFNMGVDVDVTVSDKMQCPAGDMETFQISPHTIPFRLEAGRTGTSEFVCSN